MRMSDRVGMKKITAFLVSIVIGMCLFFGAVDCRAAQENKEPGVAVADDAEILMEEEADWLKGVAQVLSDKSGWNVVVATCSDAKGKKAQTVCEEYFNQYTAGNDGISCLVDLDNRELYLATAGDAQLYLTDVRLDAILNKAYTAAKEEDYTQALYLMLSESDQAYSKGIPEGVEVQEKEGKKMGRLGSIMFTLVAAMGGYIIGKMIRDRSGAKRPGYRRRPVNAVRKSPPRSANRSTVHRGAGGRKFGGRGKKF